MGESLSQPEFLEHCRRVLGPHSLLPLAARTLSLLEPFEPRFAYYFNPHLVSTRVLDFAADARPGIVRAVGAWAAATAAIATPASTTAAASSGPTGIPDGHSKHEELYFDSPTGAQAFALHRAGMSFRVRVTSQGAPAGEAGFRVLMILTCHPRVAGRPLPVTPQDHWDALGAGGSELFRPLQPFRSSPLASLAIPSVAHCLVAQPNRAKGIGTLLDRLAQVEEIEGSMLALARLRKDSVKFAIHPWHQNPVTGEMQPAWAYAALDRIQTQVLRPAGPPNPRWLDLDQMELEVGPQPELASTALNSLQALDRRLESQSCTVSPAFGRKIHRILFEQGIRAASGAP